MTQPKQQNLIPLSEEERQTMINKVLDLEQEYDTLSQEWDALRLLRKKLKDQIVEIRKNIVNIIAVLKEE